MWQLDGGLRTESALRARQGRQRCRHMHSCHKRRRPHAGSAPVHPRRKSIVACLTHRALPAAAAARRPSRCSHHTASPQPRRPPASQPDEQMQALPAAPAARRTCCGAVPPPARALAARRAHPAHGRPRVVPKPKGTPPDQPQTPGRPRAIPAQCQTVRIRPHPSPPISIPSRLNWARGAGRRDRSRTFAGS
jgi:hypothetical protein